MKDKMVQENKIQFRDLAWLFMGICLGLSLGLLWGVILK